MYFTSSAPHPPHLTGDDAKLVGPGIVGVVVEEWQLLARPHRPTRVADARHGVVDAVAAHDLQCDLGLLCQGRTQQADLLLRTGVGIEHGPGPGGRLRV